MCNCLESYVSLERSEYVSPKRNKLYDPIEPEANGHAFIWRFLSRNAIRNYTLVSLSSKIGKSNLKSLTHYRKTFASNRLHDET